MSEHTQGPLHTCADGDCHCGAILDQHSGFVARVPIEEDRRRLVACWNACQGLDTDLLESITMLGETLADRFELRNSTERELTAQRDDLLAALEKMVQAMIDYEMIVDGESTAKHRIMMAEARAAIAKAKEAE
jgi:hypothetical protein